MKRKSQILACHTVLLVGLLSGLAGCALAQEAGQKTEAAPSASSKKPIELLDGLDAKLKSSGYSAVWKEHRQQILQWQTDTEAKKVTEPLGMQPFKDHVTVAALQKALGKPDHQTTDKLPGLTSFSGDVTGPVFWYGDVGFGFLQGGTRVDGLWMLKYVTK